MDVKMSWQQHPPPSRPSSDAVAESELIEVLKSLVSNIWLRYVSV